MISRSRRSHSTSMQRCVATFVVLASLAMAGCSAGFGDGGAEDKAKRSDPIVALASKLTVEQKVGQLFVAEVSGDGPDAVSVTNTKSYGQGMDTPAKIVAHYQPGGVVYFRANGNLVRP